MRPASPCGAAAGRRARLRRRARPRAPARSGGPGAAWRIRLLPDAALSEALPPRQAIIEITTRDGRRLREHARAVRGTPDSPMDRREVEAKALDLLAPVLGAERARALADQMWRIERVPAVRTLRPFLQA